MAETVQDKKAEFSLNVSVIVQTLILAAIVGNAKILLDIKDQLTVNAIGINVNQQRINDHERRISNLESYKKR